jgi:hypothetical protein
VPWLIEVLRCDLILGRPRTIFPIELYLVLFEVLFRKLLEAQAKTSFLVHERIVVQSFRRGVIVGHGSIRLVDLTHESAMLSGILFKLTGYVVGSRTWGVKLVNCRHVVLGTCPFCDEVDAVRLLGLR